MTEQDANRQLEIWARHWQGTSDGWILVRNNLRRMLMGLYEGGRFEAIELQPTRLDSIENGLARAHEHIAQLRAAPDPSKYIALDKVVEGVKPHLDLLREDIAFLREEVVAQNRALGVVERKTEELAGRIEDVNDTTQENLARIDTLKKRLDKLEAKPRSNPKPIDDATVRIIALSEDGASSAWRISAILEQMIEELAAK